MPIRRRHLVVSTIGVLLLYLSCDSDRSSPLPRPGEPPTPPAPVVCTTRNRRPLRNRARRNRSTDRECDQE